MSFEDAEVVETASATTPESVDGRDDRYAVGRRGLRWTGEARLRFGEFGMR